MSTRTNDFAKSALGNHWHFSFIQSDTFLDFINLLPDACILSHEDGRVLLTNLRAQELFGYTKAEFLSCTVEDLVPKNIREAHPQMRAAFFRDPKPRYIEARDVELTAVRKNGDSFPMDSALFAIHSDEGPIAVNLLRDVTESKQNERRISEYAFVDALTNLPNRRYFDSNLKRNAAKARRHDQQIGLLFIDLDKFKPINDNAGHQVGDEVLMQLAQRLAKLAREEDFVGRIGGDEFVFMVYPLPERGALELIAKRIIADFEKPININGIEYQVSASIGIAIDGGSQLDEVALLKNADKAMYAAKRKGGNALADEDGF